MALVGFDITFQEAAAKVDAVWPLTGTDEERQRNWLAKHIIRGSGAVVNGRLSPPAQGKSFYAVPFQAAEAEMKKQFPLAGSLQRLIQDKPFFGTNKPKGKLVVMLSIKKLLAHKAPAPIPATIQAVGSPNVWASPVRNTEALAKVDAVWPPQGTDKQQRLNLVASCILADSGMVRGGLLVKPPQGHYLTPFSSAEDSLKRVFDGADLPRLVDGDPFISIQVGKDGKKTMKLSIKKLLEQPAAPPSAAGTASQVLAGQPAVVWPPPVGSPAMTDAVCYGTVMRAIDERFPPSGQQRQKQQSWLAIYIIKASSGAVIDDDRWLSLPVSGKDYYSASYLTADVELKEFFRDSSARVGSLVASDPVFGCDKLPDGSMVVKLNVKKLLTLTSGPQPKAKGSSQGQARQAVTAAADTAAMLANGASTSSASRTALGGGSAAAAAAKVRTSPGSSTWDNVAQWRSAPVVFFASTYGLDKIISHLSACSVVGFDSEHRDVPGGGHDRNRLREVALMQLAAPAVHGFVSTIYLVDALAADVQAELQQGEALRDWLEDAAVTKVVHDAREDAKIFWDQYGIKLSGILDTQVLHGLSSLGAALTVPKGAAAGGELDTRRIGLQALYKAHGLPHPQKTKVQAMFASADGGLWAQRPLPKDLWEYAASDVRFLVPLASKLQQRAAWPEALGTLQALTYAGVPLPWAVGDGSVGKQGGPLVLQVPYILSIDERGLATYTRAEAVPAGRKEDEEGEEEGQQQEIAAPRMFDAGVASTMSLLPPSLQAQLQPWLAPKPGDPLLQELLLHGRDRPAIVRLSDGTVVALEERVPLSEALQALRQAQSEAATGRSGSACMDTDRLFDSSNRLSLPGSLHRISGAMARDGKTVVGLTYRVGRHVHGAAAPLRDLLHHMARIHRGQAPGKCFNLKPTAELTGPLEDGSCGLGGSPSLLLLGRPGTGKTTVLRDVARVFSDELGLSVVVVDTSNEIAGDGDEPHPCIGSALRLQVRHRKQQADVMLEAVQNHAPDVVIVDEIGTPEEAHTARQIAQRGVMLVATAHGLTLGDLMRNPDLVRLIGGIQPVTLGDEAARAHGGRKTKMERAGAGVFQLLVELSNRRSWRVHLSVDSSVDALLEGQAANVHVRTKPAVAVTAGTEIGQAGSSAIELEARFETVAAARQAAALAAEGAKAEGAESNDINIGAPGDYKAAAACAVPNISDDWLRQIISDALEKLPGPGPAGKSRA